MDINFNVFLENIEYKKGIKSNQNHSSVFTVYVYSNPFFIETYPRQVYFVSCFLSVLSRISVLHWMQ